MNNISAVTTAEEQLDFIENQKIKNVNIRKEDYIPKLLALDVSMMMTLKALVNIGKHYLRLIKIQGYERISKYVDKEFLKIIIEIFSSINNCLCERKCVYTSN